VEQTSPTNTPLDVKFLFFARSGPSQNPDMYLTGQAKTRVGHSRTIQHPLQVLQDVCQPIRSLLRKLKQDSRGHSQSISNPNFSTGGFEQDRKLLTVLCRRRPSASGHGREASSRHWHIFFHGYLARAFERQRFLLAGSREPHRLLIHALKD
jgi:hypothetical protein